MIGSSGVNRFYLAACILLVARIGWSDAAVKVDYRPDNGLVDRVRVALIIDDLGHVGGAGKRVIALDGPVACAILPHTPYARSIARQAHVAGKEVMLHLPLQSVNEFESTGFGTIKIETTQTQLIRILESDIGSIPHIVGVNNHMGSLLTQHPGHMNWLMSALKARGNLFFVDSYTSDASVALQIAHEHGLPATRRDVFLDNIPTRAAIDKEFQRWKKLAREHGSAVAIGHPYPATLSYLESALSGLASEGIELVSVEELLREKQFSTSGEFLPN